MQKFLNFFKGKSQNDKQIKDQEQQLQQIQPIQQEFENVDNKHYDVAIIGGGSAGLALCIEAKYLGLNSIIFDFVDPTQKGFQWGLGGTCVNVGCIPKKLMHTAALMKETIQNSIDFGWNLKGINDDTLPINNKKKKNNQQDQNLIQFFSWQSMVQRIQTYIRDLNFAFTVKLNSLQIPYINAIATLADKNTILFSKNKNEIEQFVKTQQQGNLRKITADYIVIAVGGRPNYLKNSTNWKDYSITSDDLFSLKAPPKKTLIVGGGYIAVETAGILSSLGYPVTLMTRGSFLKDFDKDCVDEILSNLKTRNKVKIIENTLPYQIDKNNKDILTVKWQNQNNLKEDKEQFDTVMMAIGRQPNTSLLNLTKVGVRISDKGKIIGGYNNEMEQSSIKNIYALGDVLEGVPELQPIAAKSGLFLARRINYFKNQKYLKKEEYQKTLLNYENCPTTMFTPFEYSCCGLNEKQAQIQYGKSNIETFHSKFVPLEESLCTRYDENFNNLKRIAYCKIICNKSDNNRILGIHYIGPNAGEIMQGLSIAFKTKQLTKQLLDNALGIHPTCAEQFVQLSISKESGIEPSAGPC